MRRLAVIAIAALAVLGGARPALAHVELVEADPAVDADVSEGVERVVLTMSALDAERPVEVEVTDAAGEDVTDGDARVDARRSTIEVPTHPLRPGQHIVHWHAWSDDGDGESEGTFRFTVVEAPGTGWGIWLVWIAAIGIPAAVFLRPGARKKEGRSR